MWGGQPPAAYDKSGTAETDAQECLCWGLALNRANGLNLFAHANHFDIDLRAQSPVPLLTGQHRPKALLVCSYRWGPTGTDSGSNQPQHYKAQYLNFRRSL